MVEVRRNPPPEAVRQAAQHVLFVEGQRDSIDRAAMHEFLGDLVRVEPLGSSPYLENAARALQEFHPTYYFLIDRDHHEEAHVQRSWERFPDPATHNLILWRRRELENYFIIPEYLLRSAHLVSTETELRACIRDECQKRLYLDAANQVITECRGSLGRNWIKHFDKVTACATREATLQALCARQEFADKRADFAACSHPDALGARFLAFLDELTGGHDPLEFGHGRWLELLRGKHVLPTVVAHCFVVRAADGTRLQAPRNQLELARELLQRPLAEQPLDLQELRRLIEARVRPVAP